MESPRDILNQRLNQVSAMLNVIYGGGLESFDGLNDEIKDHYFFAMSTLMDEAIKASKEI